MSDAETPAICRFCGYTPSHGTYYLVTPDHKTWQCESVAQCRNSLRGQVEVLERMLRRVQVALGDPEGKWELCIHAARIYHEHQEMRAELDDLKPGIRVSWQSPPRRIVDTGPKARKVDPAVVAEALGANVVEPREVLHRTGPIDQRAVLDVMDPIFAGGKDRLCCEPLEDEIRAGGLIHVDNIIGFPYRRVDESVIHGAVRPIWHCPLCGTKLSKWLGGEPHEDS